MYSGRSHCKCKNILLIFIYYEKICSDVILCFQTLSALSGLKVGREVLKNNSKTSFKYAIKRTFHGYGTISSNALRDFYPLTTEKKSQLISIPKPWEIIYLSHVSLHMRWISPMGKNNMKMLLLHNGLCCHAFKLTLRTPANALDSLRSHSN